MSTRLKINRKIFHDLEKAQSGLKMDHLSEHLHPHRDALALYLDTWVRPYLSHAIQEIKNEGKK